jgi:alkylhydroperoxidase family enzyme
MTKATINAEKPTGRLPLLEPKDMTPEQREKYESSPANRIYLSRLLGHASTLSPHFTAFNVAMATSITVPPLERELMVLAVLHLERGEYEWAQHMEVARMMEIPQAKVDAIANDRFGDPVFNDRERALLAFTRQVVKTVRVDDFVFSAVSAFYDPRQLVETVMVIGNYMMLLRVSEMAELPVDGVAGADFWKHQKK